MTNAMSTFMFIRLVHVMSAVFSGGLVASLSIVAARSAVES